MPPKKKKLRLDKACRACLTECGALRPIFETRISEMMMACAPIKIIENDGLPSYVCITCHKQINRFFKFKKKLERSDAALRLRLKELKQANIIAQAANDADIELTPAFSGNESKGIDNDFEEAESDDDEPLAARQARLMERTKRLSRLSKTKANNLIESVVNLTDDYSDIITNSTEEELVDDPEEHNLQSTTIFTDGPPPLVPLVPVSTAAIPEFPIDTATPSDMQLLKPICAEAPPLIPIKPLSAVDPVSVLTSLSPEVKKQLTLQCSVCSDDDFNDIIELKNHMSVHSNSSNLICNICKKEFADKKRLIGHLKGHMVVKHYACKLCGKRYPNPSTFKVHMRTHTGERPFKCDVCGKGFIRWAGVVGHMKSHNPNTPYKCNICQKGFKISSNLERHKILHSGEMPFCCSYCGKTFSQNDNLQLHVRMYHTYERPYLCSECGKGFVSVTRLNRHMWVHTGYKPYSCKYCEKSYSNSNDLKYHERTHHGGPEGQAVKPHACPTCHMRFFHPCRLAKHVKTHEKPYACSDCSKTFSKQECLRRHIVNKHNEDIQVFKPEEIYLTHYQ